MKHFGLWVYSIGLGMITGSFIGLFLRRSEASEWIPIFLITGFLMAIIGLLALPPEDWRYLP